MTLLWLGLLLVALAAFGLANLYDNRLTERDSLSRSVDVAQSSLPNLVSKQAALKAQALQVAEQKVQASDKLKLAAAAFSLDLESIEYGEALFSLATGNNLQIKTITAGNPTPRAEDGISYATASYAVSMNGKADDISKFLQALVTDIRFSSVSISAVGIGALDKAESTLQITLTSYGYEAK